RALRLIEPLEAQWQRQHAASLRPFHWHQHPVGLAQVSDRPLRVDLRRSVNDANGRGTILAEHQVVNRRWVEVEHARHAVDTCVAPRLSPCRDICTCRYLL